MFTKTSVALNKMENIFPAHKKLNAATTYTMSNADIILLTDFIYFLYFMIKTKEQAMPNIASDVLESTVAE